MSRTKAEKKAIRQAKIDAEYRARPRKVYTIPESVTPEVGLEAVKHLLEMVDHGEATCSFAMSRKWAGGTCAQENGRGFDCFTCRSLYFLKKIGVLPS